MGQAPRVQRARAARDSLAWRPASLLQRQGGGGCLMTTMTTRLISLPRPPRHQAAARRRRQACRRRKRACRLGWRRAARAAGRAGVEDFLGATTTRMPRCSGSLRARAACRNVAPVLHLPCPEAVLWRQQQQQQELVAAVGPRGARARTSTGLLKRRQASRRKRFHLQRRQLQLQRLWRRRWRRRLPRRLRRRLLLLRRDRVPQWRGGRGGCLAMTITSRTTSSVSDPLPQRPQEVEEPAKTRGRRVCGPQSPDLSREPACSVTKMRMLR